MRLIDCLLNWEALCARVPPSRWRTPDGQETGPACTHRDCEYVQLYQAEAMAPDTKVHPARRRKIKPCTHRHPDMVPAGVPFRRALDNSISDPHMVVALKADIERQLSKLPPLPRALFKLMYQSGRRNLTMDQARQAIGVPSLRAVAQCHALWLGRMEAALSDWFPRGGRDAG